MTTTQHTKENTMVTFIENNLVPMHPTLWLNDVIAFWYNGKYRKGRVIELTDTWMRCEMETDNGGNLYNRNIESGEFRTFHYDKVEGSPLMYGRAVDQRGVPYGDADFARSNAHLN
jgi:hypothetical protein